MDSFGRTAKLTEKAGLAIPEILNESFLCAPIESENVHGTGFDAYAASVTESCIYFSNSHSTP